MPLLVKLYLCKHDVLFLFNTGLRANLEQKLYGQHLVGKVVANHIQAHVRNKNPHKALALSFHGSTGTGKNHVSRIIAEALYKKGLHSKNVHLISSTKEFPHQEMLPLYKVGLDLGIVCHCFGCFISVVSHMLLQAYR